MHEHSGLQGQVLASQIILLKKKCKREQDTFAILIDSCENIKSACLWF